MTDEKARDAEAKKVEKEMLALLHRVRPETLTGGITDFMLDELQRSKDPLPWANRTAKEQQRVIDRAKQLSYMLVEQVVKKVAADGRATIQAELQQVTIKDGIKAVLLIDADDDLRHELIDATGSKIQIVLANVRSFTGDGKYTVAKPDQKDLLADEEEVTAEPDEIDAAGEEADTPDDGSHLDVRTPKAGQDHEDDRRAESGDSAAEATEDPQEAGAPEPVDKETQREEAAEAGPKEDAPPPHAAEIPADLDRRKKKAVPAEPAGHVDGLMMIHDDNLKVMQVQGIGTDGALAFSRGDTIDTNPYGQAPDHMDAFSAWESGWKNAKKMQEDLQADAAATQNKRGKKAR